jgi:hypothetical protein
MTHARVDLHPHLEGLVAEADRRGWVRDTSKGAPPARWVSGDDSHQLTVVGYDHDFRTAVITAHTPDDQFRVSVGDVGRLPQAVDAVRAFLGWDDARGNEREATGQ